MVTLALPKYYCRSVDSQPKMFSENWASESKGRWCHPTDDKGCLGDQKAAAGPQWRAKTFLEHGFAAGMTPVKVKGKRREREIV